MTWFSETADHLEHGFKKTAGSYLIRYLRQAANGEFDKVRPFPAAPAWMRADNVADQHLVLLALNSIQKTVTQARTMARSTIGTDNLTRLEGYIHVLKSILDAAPDRLGKVRVEVVGDKRLLLDSQRRQ